MRLTADPLGQVYSGALIVKNNMLGKKTLRIGAVIITGETNSKAGLDGPPNENKSVELLHEFF